VADLKELFNTELLDCSSVIDVVLEIKFEELDLLLKVVKIRQVTWQVINCCF